MQLRPTLEAENTPQAPPAKEYFASSGPPESISASRVSSTSIVGISALGVEVEAKRVMGKGALRIVGLPDGVLREARDRVRCAILNSGFDLPEGEIVVSLSPAELPKTGSGFDLPIALSILAATGQLNPHGLQRTIFLGELALDGRLRKVRGALASGVSIKRQEELSLVIPSANGPEAAVLDCDRILLAETLKHVVACINGVSSYKRLPSKRREFREKTALTFIDVRGQQVALRACEIAAAGGHNLLLVGPPGSGKSMIAQRLPSILPPLHYEELLEILSIYDAHQSGRTADDLRRPFRAPHHTCSTSGLVGGGPGPAPGEISLAHGGVLFLDELPEFRREALESLRQPLEERCLTVSRANRRVTFPANFSLIAAMNPCPCGRKGSTSNDCRCSIGEVRRYLSKISGPLLDRIDLQLWLAPPPASELSKKREDDPTDSMREAVIRSREKQLKRTGCLNGGLTAAQLQSVVNVAPDAHSLLLRAVEKLNMSARSYMRTLKVARTIADLSGRETVEVSDISEALSYRLRIEEFLL